MAHTFPQTRNSNFGIVKVSCPSIPLAHTFPQTRNSNFGIVKVSYPSIPLAHTFPQTRNSNLGIVKVRCPSIPLAHTFSQTRNSYLGIFKVSSLFILLRICRLSDLFGGSGGQAVRTGGSCSYSLLVISAVMSSNPFLHSEAR